MKKVILLIMIIFSLASCKKENIDPVIVPTVELEASDNFDWKTTKDITLEISGMDVSSSINRTLYVKSSIGDTIYKELLFMNKDYTLVFTVPSTERSIDLEYGTKKQKIDLVSNVITFDYIVQ